MKHIFDTKEKSLLLITEYAARRHKFENSLDRDTALYLEIRNVFHEKGYSHVTTENLKKRMAYLRGRFHYLKDMARMCTGSGAEFTNWEFYDAMGQLDEGKAAESPRKLVGMGSSNYTHTRQGTTSSDNSDTSESPSPHSNNKRKGRRRHEAHKTESGRGVSGSSKTIKRTYARRVSITPLKERRYRQGEQIQESISRVASILEDHFKNPAVVRREL